MVTLTRAELIFGNSKGTDIGEIEIVSRELYDRVKAKEVSIIKRNSTIRKWMKGISKIYVKRSPGAIYLKMHFYGEEMLISTVEDIAEFLAKITMVNESGDKQ